MKKFAKNIAIVALAAVAAVGMAVGLTACGSSGGAVDDVKVSGYYTEFTAGNRPMDLTNPYMTYTCSNETVTLYNDGTYARDSFYALYMPAASAVVHECEVRIFGTYEITSEDEYGVDFTLSAATGVIYRWGSTYADTSDPSTMSGEEDDTADYYLGLYAEATSGWSIDYESYALTVASDDNPVKAFVDQLCPLMD